jgi:hypothetical protein
MLARVYPRVTADAGMAFHYEPADGRFSMQAIGASGDPTTVVFVPKEITGQITSAGAVRLVVSENEGDGSRLAIASPTGGPFTVAVAPAPLRLSACPG